MLLTPQVYLKEFKIPNGENNIMFNLVSRILSNERVYIKLNKQSQNIHKSKRFFRCWKAGLNTFWLKFHQTSSCNIFCIQGVCKNHKPGRKPAAVARTRKQTNLITRRGSRLVLKFVSNNIVTRMTVITEHFNFQLSVHTLRYDKRIFR